MKRIGINRGALFLGLFLLGGISCENLDLVGKDSAAAFERVLNQIPQGVTPDEPNGGWSLAAPDQSARFIWSKQYGENPYYDVMLELDAGPFITAGLDPHKLPENYDFYQDKIMVGRKLGKEEVEYQGPATPLASYQQLVKLRRNILGYHGALDHYGINLGEGNLFEWAKDMGTNDKDIVFVLNPAPLVAAGLDPRGIEGWVFAKVTVDDERGKPIQVDKLLKPFNLR